MKNTILEINPLYQEMMDDELIREMADADVDYTLGNNSNIKLKYTANQCKKELMSRGFMFEADYLPIMQVVQLTNQILNQIS